MTEYSRVAQGRFTSTGAAQQVNLPFIPDRVEFINFTSTATPAEDGIPSATWTRDMGQGFAAVNIFQAAAVYTTDTVLLNGISTFEAGLSLQYDAVQTVTDITKAAAGVVTVTAHGYATGDVVLFADLSETATTGMNQLDGIPFVITRVDANSFSIPWNTNQGNYTVISGAATGTPTVKRVRFPFLYEPGVSYITALTLAATTTVVTTTPHNFVAGQEVAFRIPTLWGTTELNSLPNVTIPGSPIYGFVTSVTNTTTVVVNIV